MTFVRSPTLTKFESGRIDERLEAGEARAGAGPAAGPRGGTPRTAAAIARMCAGVVPQQPPTMLRKPARAHSPRSRAIDSGRLVEAAERVRAGRRSGRRSRSTARGPTAPRRAAASPSGPSAQLMPTREQRRVRDRDPERLDRLAREVAARQVGDRDRGHHRAARRRARRRRARSRRARPWRSACRRRSRRAAGRRRRRGGRSACSWYAASSSSKVTPRAPGSFTSRDSEAVLFVGPERAGHPARRGPAPRP